MESRTRVGTAGDASKFPIVLQEPIEIPNGCVCWVAEMQLPLVQRNIEPACKGRIYIREIDNRYRRTPPRSGGGRLRGSQRPKT